MIEGYIIYREEKKKAKMQFEKSELKKFETRVFNPNPRIDRQEHSDHTKFFYKSSSYVDDI